MIVFLNGRLVPEEEARISVFDRGFLYGDGLFETIRVFNGKPFRWPQHLERLDNGARVLGLRLPFSAESLRKFVDALIQENHQPDALLRVTLSRGVGVRGYSPRGAEHPTLVMSMHPVLPGGAEALQGWRLLTSTVRLPANQRLAQFKTCNKLPQILARAEADAANCNEALLANTDGFLVEGASSNLFWIKEGHVYTSPLASGILPGVTRAAVFEICRNLGLATSEDSTVAEELIKADGVFLSLSSVGIAEGISLDNRSLRRSDIPSRIHSAYWGLLRHETNE
jgi:branched-chain amino acid aminotransferase